MRPLLKSKHLLIKRMTGHLTSALHNDKKKYIKYDFSKDCVEKNKRGGYGGVGRGGVSQEKTENPVLQ